MGSILARNLARGPDRCVSIRRLAATLPVLAGLTFIAAGCHSIPPVDTKPLDTAGMTFDSIQQLKTMNITTPEVADVAAARESGFSDTNCIAVFKIFRDRKRPFDAGQTIAGLVGAQMSESTILELARMDELGISAGEFEAMRLAGLSDSIVLEVARHRAANQPVLSGASLAGLKNVGVRESTLLELARRGIPDSQANAITAFRRRGASDAEILSHFTGRS